MDILLRKASTYEKAAVAAAVKIDLDPALKLSVHTVSAENLATVKELLSHASHQLTSRLNNAMELYMAAGTIRTLAKAANSKKVDMLLTEKRTLDALEKLLTSILSMVPKIVARRVYESTVTVAHDAQATLNTITNLRARSAVANSGNVPADIELPALDQASIANIESRLAAMRRRRGDLMDELAQANLNERITLPDGVVTILRQHGIIE